MTKTKQAKSMGIMLIAAGMFFLINPMVNIIDIIPDFIGYLMIISGIDRLADMEDHFASSKRGFVILAVVSAVKTGACLLLPFIDATFIILLSFIFAVGETVCFIPTVVNLFGGFHYYGLRLESQTCYGIYKYVTRKDENGNKVKAWGKAHSSDSVLAFTIIAFVVRAASCFLPQLPTIFSNRSSGVINAGPQVDWTYFMPHLYILCGIIALAVSLPWAFRFRRYIKGIADDKQLMAELEKNYEENIAHDECHFAEKKTMAVWILTIVAAVFCFSIYIDYVNWLPGGIAGIAFAVAAIMLRSISKSAIPTAIFGFITVIPSAIEVIWQYQYAALKYTPTSFMYGIGKSTVLYPRIMVIEAIAAVSLIVTIWLFAKCLRDMTSQHCKLYEKALPETRSGKGAGLCLDISNAYNIAFALMTAMSVVSGAHGIVAVYYPEIWILNILIGIVMAVFLLRARNMAKDDLYDKLRDRI